MANKVILKDNDGTQLLPYVKTECVVDLGLASTIENGLMSKEDKSLIENWKAEFGKGIAEITYTKTGGDEEQVKITAYACVGFPNSEDYEPISSGEVILTSAGESGIVRLSVPKDAQYFIKTYTDNSSYSVSDKDTVYTSNGGVTEEISLDVVYNIFDVAMIELTNGKLVKPEDYVSDANSIYFNDRTTAVYIALNNTSSNASWGGSGTDIEGITNYTNMTSVFEDKDGKSNTNAILDTLKGTSSAALSTRNYVFPNGTVGYLPAAGEFKVVTNNLTQINAALTTAGGTTIATGTYYLTSSEYNSSNGIRCNGSGTASYVSKSTSTAIRPFKIATKEVSVIKNIKLNTGEVATGYTLKINGKDETNSTTASLPIGKSIFEVSLPNYITVYGVLNVSANTESVTIEAVMVKEWQTVTFNISTNVSSPVIVISGPLPNGSNGTVSATVSGSSYTFSAKIGQNYTVRASKTDYEDDSTSVKIIQDTFNYDVSLLLYRLIEITVNLSSSNYDGEINAYCVDVHYKKVQFENNTATFTVREENLFTIWLNDGLTDIIDPNNSSYKYYYNDEYYIHYTGPYGEGKYMIDVTPKYGTSVYNVTCPVYPIEKTYTPYSVTSPWAYPTDTSAQIEFTMFKKIIADGVVINEIIEDTQTQTVTFPTNNTRTMPPTVDYTTGGSLVDLGLPSGTLWASCNFGAANEMDSGLYFQYGDTNGYRTSDFAKVTKRTGSFEYNGATVNWTVGQIDNGKLFDELFYDHPLCTNKPIAYGGHPNFPSNFTIDGNLKSNLNPIYDPLALHGTATSGVRIPTKEEIQELLDNTDAIKIISDYKTIGWKLQSKVNSNYIIIPLCAYYYETRQYSTLLSNYYYKGQTSALTKYTSDYVYILSSYKYSYEYLYILFGRSDYLQLNNGHNYIYEAYNIRGVK